MTSLATKYFSQDRWTAHKHYVSQSTMRIRRLRRYAQKAKRMHAQNQRRPLTLPARILPTDIETFATP